jgi:hypothetical protein
MRTDEFLDQTANRFVIIGYNPFTYWLMMGLPNSELPTRKGTL